jgi:Na+/proline symporter
MFWFSIILVLANVLFLMLGALLYIYSSSKGIEVPASTDDLFPFLAVHHFSTFAGIVFLLGITAAAYSSADSALTALTTSFCIDILNFKEGEDNRSTRFKVHIGFSLLLLLVIVIFKHINNQAVISAVFTAAGYTYGPLLGLYTFGLFTRMKPNDKFVPWICVASPIISFIINLNSQQWFNGYKFGFEILMVNGFITFLGLWLVSRNQWKK